MSTVEPLAAAEEARFTEAAARASWWKPMSETWPYPTMVGSLREKSDAEWLAQAFREAVSKVHDYGTKFLVTAGLLNILAMVDAFEIAAGRKD